MIEMKQIKIISALCLAVAFLLPAAGSAQTNRQARKNNKSVNKNEERQPQDTIFVMPQVDSVQVAFRKVAKRDLLGDVSTINISQMLEKNYTTSSLESLDALGGVAHQARQLAAPAEQQQRQNRDDGPVPDAHRTHGTSPRSGRCPARSNT